MTPEEGTKKLNEEMLLYWDKYGTPPSPEALLEVTAIIQQCVDDAVEKALDEERERDMPQYGKEYLKSLWPWNR